MWNGLSKKNRIKLEGVQRAATRFILSYPKDMSYKDRLLKLQILPLSYRRDSADIKLLYKLIYCDTNFNLANYVRFCNSGIVFTRSNADPNMLCTPHCNTDCFKSTFFNRIVNTWNSLPISIRLSKSISTLKNNIHNLLLNRTSDFNPSCCCCLYTTCSS